MNLEKLIRTIPDYPKPGIMFRDITTLLKDPAGFKYVIDTLAERYRDRDFDVIAGIEARGFIIGAALSYALNKGFVPIRKKGKLPGATHSCDYALEYGTDTIEVHHDAFDKDSRVLLVDDLLATGGTALGGASLVETAGAKVSEICFIVDLPELGGGKKLTEKGYVFHTMIEFEGE
jgi:adenine phosphoribosyltransferase